MSSGLLRFVRGVALAAVALLGSCYNGLVSPLGDEPMSGVWVLVEVNGQPLPADTPNDTDVGNGMITRIVADTLILRRGGVGAWRSVWHRRYVASGAPVDSGHWRDLVRYTRSGSAVRFEDLVCNPGCVSWGYGDEARIDANGDLIRQHPGGPNLQSERRYQRLLGPAVP